MLYILPMNVSEGTVFFLLFFSLMASLLLLMNTSRYLSFLHQNLESDLSDLSICLSSLNILLNLVELDEDQILLLLLANQCLQSHLTSPGRGRLYHHQTTGVQILIILSIYLPAMKQDYLLLLGSVAQVKKQTEVELHYKFQIKITLILAI